MAEIMLQLHDARARPWHLATRLAAGHPARLLDVLGREHDERAVERPAADIDESRNALEQEVAESLGRTIAVPAVPVRVQSAAGSRARLAV